MRKVFIDCGYSDGGSTKFFRKHHPQSNEFEIFAFECDPNVDTPELPGVAIINAGIWIADGKRRFYLSPGDGSSFFKRKKTGKLNIKMPVSVNIIDFSKWIMSNFKKEDYIIVKMNVEGAEYPVLRKMINDGSIKYIDRLYIQWHRRKLRLMKKSHVALKKDLTCETYDWGHCDKYVHRKVRQRFITYFKSTL